MANIGAKRPYAAPPIILPTMPMNGHENTTTEMHRHSTSFKTGPNCLDLELKKCESNYTCTLQNITG